MIGALQRGDEQRSEAPADKEHHLLHRERGPRGRSKTSFSQLKENLLLNFDKNGVTVGRGRRRGQTERRWLKTFYDCGRGKWRREGICGGEKGTKALPSLKPDAADNATRRKSLNGRQGFASHLGCCGVRGARKKQPKWLYPSLSQPPPLSCGIPHNLPSNWRPLPLRYQFPVSFSLRTAAPFRF